LGFTIAVKAQRTEKLQRSFAGGRLTNEPSCTFPTSLEALADDAARQLRWMAHPDREKRIEGARNEEHRRGAPGAPGTVP
jgi:hypothetical protein